MNSLVPLQSALSPHLQARLRRLLHYCGQEELSSARFPVSPLSVRFDPPRGSEFTPSIAPRNGKSFRAGA